MTEHYTIVTRVIYLHYSLKRVEDFHRETPEKDINVLVMNNDLQSNWGQEWQKHYGKLLHVQRVEESFPMPDPIQLEIEVL